jgi:hypothetical protein
MRHLFDLKSPIKFGLPKQVSQATAELRRHWSPADRARRQLHAAHLQKQIAFLAAFEPRELNH